MIDGPSYVQASLMKLVGRKESEALSDFPGHMGQSEIRTRDPLSFYCGVGGGG